MFPHTQTHTHTRPIENFYIYANFNHVVFIVPVAALIQDDHTDDDDWTVVQRYNTRFIEYTSSSK